MLTFFECVIYLQHESTIVSGCLLTSIISIMIDWMQVSLRGVYFSKGTSGHHKKSLQLQTPFSGIFYVLSQSVIHFVKMLANKASLICVYFFVAG